MRLAIISDIHGNLEALETVLADIRKQNVESIICLGDVIGYGCNPSECLSLIDENCEFTLMGNHEYVALGLLSDDLLNAIARGSAEWTRTQLSDNDLSLIADFPFDMVKDTSYFVHSSPYQPDQWHYVIKKEEAETAFNNFTPSVCFIGHSHLPSIFTMYPDNKIGQKTGHDFDLDPDNRYIINVGSVGQPRDNDPRSAYVIYDSNEESIFYKRIEYDIEKTQSRMADANIHSMLIERLVEGR